MHVAQSCKHSGPSVEGDVVGKSASGVGAWVRGGLEVEGSSGLGVRGGELVFSREKAVLRACVMVAGRWVSLMSWWLVGGGWVVSSDYCIGSDIQGSGDVAKGRNPLGCSRRSDVIFSGNLRISSAHRRVSWQVVLPPDHESRMQQRKCSGTDVKSVCNGLSHCYKLRYERCKSDRGCPISALDIRLPGFVAYAAVSYLEGVFRPSGMPASDVER